MLQTAFMSFVVFQAMALGRWESVLNVANYTALWAWVAAYGGAWALRRISKKTPFNIPLTGASFAWLGTLGISALHSGTPDTALFGMSQAALYLAVWVMLTSLLSDGTITRQNVLDGILIAGALPMVWGVIDLVSSMERISAGLENPNYAGVLFSVLIVLAIMRRQWLYMTVACVLLYATMSRSPLYLAGFGVIAFVLARRMMKIDPRLAWIIPVLIFGVARFEKDIAKYIRAPQAFVSSAQDALKSAQDITTGRTVYWQDAIQKMLDNPLGQGVFSYRSLDYLDKTRVHSQTHSLPLQVGVELGIPGLLALVLSGLQVIRQISLTKGGIWGVSALMATLPYHILDFSAQQPFCAILCLLLLAVAVRQQKTPLVKRGSSSISEAISLQVGGDRGKRYNPRPIPFLGDGCPPLNQIQIDQAQAQKPTCSTTCITQKGQERPIADTFKRLITDFKQALQVIDRNRFRRVFRLPRQS